MRVGIFKTILGSIFLTVLMVSTAKADPLVFSNVIAIQNNGSQIDLFSSSGVTLIGPQISFQVDISGDLPASGSDTLQITFSEAGRAPVIQTFNIPIFDGLSLPYSQIFTLTFQNATFQGTGASLTLDILGSSTDFVVPSGVNKGQQLDSYTYTFQGAQPIPEPSTISLLGIAITGLSLWGKRKFKSF